MSEDVKKDLRKAIQDAQKSSSSSTVNGNVVLPDPVVLKHSANDGVAFPPPAYRQDGKEESTN